jgi:hypothetical protein
MREVHDSTRHALARTSHRLNAYAFWSDGCLLRLAAGEHKRIDRSAAVSPWCNLRRCLRFATLLLPSTESTAQGKQVSKIMNWPGAHCTTSVAFMYRPFGPEPDAPAVAPAPA